MADDNLRIVARVEDQFTGPLSKLRKELDTVGKEAKKQGASWRKDWSGVTDDMTKFKGVLGGIEPVLTKIGMGGFGAALSFGGAALALKNFSGSTRDLDLMARQIGLTANQLRTLSELGGKVGISTETMKQGIQSFAGTMFELRQRWGQAYGELRSMNLGKLAEDLVNAPNMQSGFERAIDGLKGISDPQKLARVSILLFGTPDIGLVAQSLAGPAREAIRKLQAELGNLDQGTVERAKSFEENLNKMHTRWERFKLDTMGPLLGATDKALDKLTEAGDRNGIRGNEEAIQNDLTSRRDRKQSRLNFLREHGEGDPKAAEKVKRLTDEVAKLNEQLRLMREGGGAYQPMSFSPGGGSGGGGSLIHKAAWGGMGGGSDGLDGMRSRYPVPAFGGPGPLGGGKGSGPLSGEGGVGPLPGGVGTPAGAAGGPISRRDMRDVNPEMAEYIRRSAIAHGIDPNVALRIANSEGLRGSIPGVRNTPGDKGTSFGPFQLHYGSNIPGLTLKGLGDRYTKETGHHASDPKHWKEQIDFALRTARKEGWGAWHGRIGARIGVWQGIGTVKPVPIEQQAGTSSQDENGNFPNGAPRALKPQSMANDPSVPGQVVGGKGRGAGEALMDRFYGRGSAGGGPAMQMPGGGAGKGTLHIKLDGAPSGTTVRADLDDLFKGHTVSKVRPQMDLA